MSFLLTNSSIPSGPSSRPTPDRLVPPNGSSGPPMDDEYGGGFRPVKTPGLAGTLAHAAYNRVDLFAGEATAGTGSECRHHGSEDAHRGDAADGVVIGEGEIQGIVERDGGAAAAAGTVATGTVAFKKEVEIQNRARWNHFRTGPRTSWGIIAALQEDDSEERRCERTHSDDAQGEIWRSRLCRPFQASRCRRESLTERSAKCECALAARQRCQQLSESQLRNGKPEPTDALIERGIDDSEDGGKQAGPQDRSHDAAEEDGMTRDHGEHRTVKKADEERGDKVDGQRGESCSDGMRTVDTSGLRSCSAKSSRRVG